MQKDMHFFGVYALARAAGFDPKSAEVIAHSSQFVDDALEDAVVQVPDRPSVLPLMTSHRPTDYANVMSTEQWNVWVTFHFLPGAYPKDGTFQEKMTCQMDSLPAQTVLQYVLDNADKRYVLYLAGIALHVYADTFSHHGFIGFNSSSNRVDRDSIKANCSSPSIKSYVLTKLEAVYARFVGTIAEVLPIGHGAVEDLPDRPYLNWSYKCTHNSPVIQRNNPADYLEACEKMYEFLVRLLDACNLPSKVTPTDWLELKEKVASILGNEGRLEDRIDLWLKALSDNTLASQAQEDGVVWYSSETWNSAGIVHDLGYPGAPTCCDATLFLEAAWEYRTFVRQILLPQYGLLAF